MLFIWQRKEPHFAALLNTPMHVEILTFKYDIEIGNNVYEFISTTILIISGKWYWK
jgi:hypothetical protein